MLIATHPHLTLPVANLPQNCSRKQFPEHTSPVQADGSLADLDQPSKCGMGATASSSFPQNLPRPDKHRRIDLMS